MGSSNTKRGKAQQQEDFYGEMAGAIGGLVIITGILGAIKAKLGLTWPVTILLTAGVLVGIGYAAWKVRTALQRRFTGHQQPVTKLRQEAPAQAPGVAETAVEGVPAHPQLTAALRTAGAIGREEIIRADEVTVESVQTGTVYDFLAPPGRTYKDVEKKLAAIAGMFGVTRLHTKLDRSRDTERRARLLILNEPPFTKPFPAPTRQEIETFAGIPFGHDVTGQLAGVETFERASLLIGGMTQMGKTTLVNGIITCLLITYGEFDLYLLDGKHCGLTKFEKIAVRYEASDSPAVMESMLDVLNDRSEQRYAKIQEAIRNRQPAPQFRPVFFIVDEAADFFTDDGTQAGKDRARRVADKARSLVAKALESGISVVMLTQRPAQNAIPVMVRDQFLYRMCMYVASEGTAKVALGDTYFETVAPINPALLDPDVKGQGVLFAHGASTLIRGFNFKDEFIWQIVDEVHARQQREMAAVPETPLMKAIRFMEGKGLEFIYTVELAPCLGVDASNPAKAGEEVAALLSGVPRSRKSNGRGYRLADLLAAAKTQA